MKRHWFVLKQDGFTLVEAIVSMALVGIVAAGFGMALVIGVEGFRFTQDSAMIAQKSQVAMARLTRECLGITAISTATSTDMRYTAIDGDAYRIARSGGSITLERTSGSVVTAKALIGNVAASYGGDDFLRYLQANGTAWVVADGLDALDRIEVVIKIEGYINTKTLIFKTAINPRENSLRNAPVLS